MDENTLNQILDEKWDKILDELPEDALAILNGLSESEVSAEKIHQIIAESGVDIVDILSEEEEK